MRSLCWIALMAAVVGSSGCVIGRRSIDLEVPPSEVVAIATKGTVAFIDITDNRVFANKPRDPSVPSIDGDVTKESKDFLRTMIGRQRGGWGNAMGDIQLASGETVDVQMKRLLEAGFRRRGYVVSDDANADTTVGVVIDKFWAWFTPGMWAVDFEAQILSNLTLSGSGRSEQLTVSGYGKNTGQFAKDVNWQEAYFCAYEDFLKNLDAALARANF